MPTGTRYLTCPFFLLMALVTLSVMALLPASWHEWLESDRPDDPESGAVVLCCLPELILGR